MRHTFVLYILLLFCGLINAQVYKDRNAPVESRVESLLSYMSLDDKLNYIGGTNQMFIRGIPGLGLPPIKMSDGPVGVRTWGQATAYPAGICNAATWDRDLVLSLGEALGKDARARGVYILLGPGLNIYRAPMCGRNFEYFGEDPFLAGQMASQYVRGVQSQRVVSTVKHFAGNNQEWDRYDVSSDIDERTLQEIYLPAFRAAVTDAGAGAVMNAYNLLNGIHCTQNAHLNIDILKKQWQFKGILMSDWGATHDGVAAANGGLDLEMPEGDNMNISTLSTALSFGEISQETIDDKVRRILKIIFGFGFYDNIQTDSSIPLDDPENDSISLQLAREGIVLLKNDSILPLKRYLIKSIAVTGPNADQYEAGGGSSYTSPFHYISVLKGIQDLAGSNVTVNYAGQPQPSVLAQSSVFYTAPGSMQKGLYGEYFSNQALSGIPANTRIDTMINFYWSGIPNISGIPANHFSIRWIGVIRPAASDNYTFYVSGDDGFRLWVNDSLIIDNWVDEAITTKTGSISLAAGGEYDIKLEYYQDEGLDDIVMGYQSDSDFNAQVLAAAGASDVAVVCAGFNSSIEGEGFDRTFTLPVGQDSLISRVARVNLNTVVIINAGGNVYKQPWLSKIKGLIQAWYPGQDGGQAIAEILFGKTNPSGKLPVTFEKEWKDNPVYGNYYANNGANHVKYNEGLFVDYRYYDANNVEPQFPFGFGLSYTTFSYSDLSISKDTADTYLVTFDVKNTGNVAGAEVSQLYISPDQPKITRPVKELKGFSKVSLNPGQIMTISLVLRDESFSYFSIDKNTFVADSGNYDIIIGSSSRDEKLRQTLLFDRNVVIKSPVISEPASSGLLIYPVPANDYFIIQTDLDALKFKTAELFDSTGRILDQRTFTGQSLLYNCIQMRNGLYICRIRLGQQTVTRKFVIAH